MFQFQTDPRLPKRNSPAESASAGSFSIPIRTVRALGEER